MLLYIFLPLGNLIKQQIKDKGPIDVGPSANYKQAVLSLFLIYVLQAENK